MGVKFSNSALSCLTIYVLLNNVCSVSGGERCIKIENGNYIQEYCDYGCCGSANNKYCCKISTSVLVVACVVGGLVLIALIAAVVICCYKNYKDKQASRVRRLRHEEEMNTPRVRGVEPPKPPSYISAPPEYSETMPESHFRPQTVNGQIPCNQRFTITTPFPRRSNMGPGNVAATNLSSRHPVVSTRSYRAAQIPGTVETEAPPPYSEYARGRTPAHRRQRFIRTPVSEDTDAVQEQSEINNNIDANTDDLSEITQAIETPETIESRAQITRNQAGTETCTDNLNSRTRDSRVVATRAHESSVETLQRNQLNEPTASVNNLPADTARESESRAESVIRVLRPSRISRIPTRVGSSTRQLSDVPSSRASSISTLGSRNTTTVVTNHDAQTPVRRNVLMVEEGIEDLSTI